MNIQSKLNRWFSFTSLAKSTTLFAALWVAGAASSASAATGTWLGNGDAWNLASAWSGGIADGSGSTANFTGVNIETDVTMALGTDRTIGNITFTDATTSSHNLTLTGSILTLAGTPTINVTQADRTLTISSVLAGSAGITKTGQGTLTLSGVNTITGATVINGGGTLVLDYNTNDNRKLPNNSTLTLGGGTIVLKGGTATENVTGITLSGNAGTFFVRDGGTAKINLNTLGGGGFSAVSFSHDSMATTGRVNTGGILGGWYTVGNRFAANAINAAGGDIVGYTGATAFTGANGSTTGNFDLSGSLTPTSSQSFNTLRIVSTLDNQTLTLGANRITINNSQFGGSQPGGGGGALMYAGGANGNYTISGSTTDGIRWATQNGQGGLINVFSGTLTVGVGIGSGSASISKTGEGTLVLSGGNVSSGDFRIYQGVVRLRINSFGTLTNTGIVQNGAALELANNISIGKLLNITGTGVLNGGALRNFANNNTYSGAITIGTGGARINSDSGTLTLTGGVVTGGNTVTFGGAGNTTVSTAAISGTGGLVKDGAGNTTISFTSSYSGATRIDSGTLTLGHATDTLLNTGAVNVNGGTLALGVNSDTVGAVTLTSGDITGSGGTLTGTGSNYDVRKGTISAKLGGTVGLTKSTADKVTLSGVNSYTGGTTISYGTLQLDNAAALGSTSGTLTVNGGVLNLNNMVGVTVGNLTGTSGTIANNGAIDQTLTIGSGDGTGGNFQGVIADTTASDPGKLSVTKTGAGTLTLSGANTYTGGTTVNAGTLVLGLATSTLADTGAVTVNGATAILSLGGISDTVGAVTLTSGSITGTGGVLTGASYDVQSGSVSAILGGTSVTLTKTTGGTVTLTGDNTYTGATSVNDGTLQLGNGGANGTLSSSSAISVASGATFTVNRTGTVEQGSHFGTITGDGGFSQAGGGVTILKADNGYTGPTTVSAGTLQLGSGDGNGTLSSSSAISVASGATFTVNRTGTVTQGSHFGTISGDGGFSQAGGGVTILIADNNYIGPTTVSAGTLQLGNGLGIGTLSGSSAISVASGATFAVNRTGTVTQGSHFGTISGDGGFSQAGGGVTILIADNGYTGPTTVSAGTLQLGNGGANGTLSSSSAISVASGATFAVNRTGTVTQGSHFGTISGNGGFSQAGGGVTILIADNGYTGPTTVSAGTLQLGNGLGIGTLSGSSAISVASGATFAVNRTGTVTQGSHFGTISGDGGFSQAGGGVTILIADNGYTGPTTVSAGTLQLGNGLGIGTLSGSSAISVASGATFAVNRTGTVTQGSHFGTISGDGGFSQLGSGTTELNAANTYGGGTTVIAGTLLVNTAAPDSGTGTGAVTVNGGTLGGTGRIGGDVTVGANGSVAPGASAGTLSVNGNLDISALANRNVGDTGRLKFELAAPPPATGSDKIAVTGTLTIGDGVLGIRDFDFSNLGGCAAGTYKLITSGSISGQIDPLDSSRLLFGYAATLQINANGKDIDLVLASGSLPPSLSQPTVTGIDTTSATLGATIDSDGGAAITSRGTTWSLTSDGNTENSHTVSGTETGVFSDSRTGLSAGRHYYAWGWAENGQGRSYTPTSFEFYTEPDQPTLPVFSNVEGTQVTLSWTPSGTSGALVLMKSGSAVDVGDYPVDGTTYTASPVFGSGDLIGGSRVVYVGSGSSVTITGLTPQQIYYVKVYAYAGSGAALINYQQDAPLDANTTTTTRSLLWDADAGVGGQVDGSGIWGNPSQWYDSVPAGNVTWNNAYIDSATIGNSGTPGTITLDAPVTAGSVTFGPFSGTYTLSGVGSLTVNSDITVGAASGSVTISTPVSGSGGIVMNGSGSTLTLSGANDFTGPTLISNGVLQLGAGSTTGSLSINSAINNNATLIFNRSNAITQGTDFNSVIDGTGQVIQAGAGTLTLSGANTYTGVTTIQGGILSVGTLANAGSNSGLGNYPSAGAADLVFNTGAGTLQYTGNSVIIDRGFTGTLTPTFDVAMGGQTLTLGDSSLAATTLTVNSTGAGGTLALGTLTITASGATLTPNTGNLTLSTATGTDTGLTLSGSGAGVGTVGNITTGSGTLTKTGTGTWMINGGASSYTGITTISGGTLSVAKIDSTGAVSDIGQYASDGPAGLVLGGGTLRYTGAGATTGRGFTFQTATSGIDVQTAGATLTMGDCTLNFAGQLTITGGSGSALTLGTVTLTLAPTLDVANGVTLTIGSLTTNTAITKQNSGTLFISGAADMTRTTGATTLTLGTLKLGVATALSSSGAAPINLNGGTLHLATTDGTIMTTHAVTMGGSAGILVDRASNGSVNYAMNTLNIGAHTLSVTVGGNVSGTAALTFSGNTTFSATPPVFDVASGANLTIGALQTAGSFTKQNSGQLTLSTVAAAARSSGTVTLSAGTLKTGGTVGATEDGLGKAAVALQLNGGILDLATDSSTLAHTTTVGGDMTILSDRATGPNTGITHTLGALSIGAYTLTLAKGDNATSGSPVVAFGATTLTGYPVFNATTAGLTITTLTGPGTASGVVTFQGAANTTVTGAIANGTQTLGVTKSGSGQLTLSGPNTYTGATTVNQGVLTVSGSIANSSAISIEASAILNATGLNKLPTGNWTIAGTLNKTDGTGQDFWNPVTLNNGTISGATDKADYGTYCWAGSTITANGSANTINAVRLGLSVGEKTVNTPLITDSLTISSIIGGSSAKTGSLTKTGLGTLILSGASIYTGTTTVNAGELRWGINNALATGDLTINSGGTVNMQNFTDTVGTITLKRGTINVTTGYNILNSFKTGSGGFITTGGTVNNWPGIGLGGNFAYNTDSGNETTAYIAGIDFNGGNRTFTIADGVQTIDVDITVSLFNGTGNTTYNFIKAGAGTMRISGGANDNYNLNAGTTSIEDGVLLLNKSATHNAVGGTGTVTIGDGTGLAGSAILRYAASDQIPNNAVTINSDGLLDLAGFNDTVGTLDVTGAAVINLGSGAALAFADSSLVDWTGGTLNITGTLGATSLRFGGSPAALTSVQLAKISVNGSGLGSYILDANGYLVVRTPQVVTLVPADNMHNVAETADLVVTFDEAVSKGTGNIDIMKSSDNSLIERIDVTSGQVTIDGAQVTINPSADLPSGIECYVLIPAGAFTAFGPFAGITDPTRWSFITAGMPPTMTGIVDNKSGGPIATNTLVTYTVTFSEDMDENTVSDTDFGNEGSADVTIGAVTETSANSGVFTVPVTPTSGGTLRLKINAGAELKDVFGIDLVTTAALLDDTTITVDVTAPSPDPMTFASPPSAITQTSITMTGTTATDPSGVQYFFACTGGGGPNSGWQSSAVFTPIGLAPNTTYSYTVRARDTVLNETAPSDPFSATTPVASPSDLYSSGTKAWDTTTANWGTVHNGPYDTPWNNAMPYSAIFEGTAGTVTLGEAISIRNLTFTHTTGTYTLTGRTLSFTGGTITASNPSGAGNVATILSNITGSPAIDLKPMDGNEQFTLNPAASGSMTIGAVSGDAGDGSEKLILQGGAGSAGTIASVSGPKVIVQGGSWTLSGDSSGRDHEVSGGTLTLNANLSATKRAVILSGTGVINYNVANAVSASVATTTSTDQGFRITGGTLDQTSGSAINANASVQTMDWAGSWTFLGSSGPSSDLHLGTGTVFLKAASPQVTVTHAATTLSVGGVIANDATGGRGLTKAGAGTLVLGGVNTYTGASTVNAGTLLIKSGGSLHASSAVAVDGGTLGGNGTINGSVTVGGAGSIAPSAPGTSSVGTLSIGGGLNVSAMANGGSGKLKFDLDAPLPAVNNDKIAVTGTLTIGSGVLGLSDFDFTRLAGFGVGTYTLITSGGINSGDTLHATDYTDVIGILRYTLQIKDNNIELVVSPVSGTVYSIR